MYLQLSLIPKHLGYWIGNLESNFFVLSLKVLLKADSIWFHLENFDLRNLSLANLNKPCGGHLLCLKLGLLRAKVSKELFVLFHSTLMCQNS